MARARAIETRLEKLVPALDEYYSSGFLTREEIVEVSRQRTHWEYRLVAKPLLLLDVRGAVTYELGLEKRLREYCIHTKLNLQHRWDILERIEGIYKVGIKHLRNRKEHEALRQEYVLFLKQFHRNGSLSNLYGELMVTYPRRSDIWVEAAEWQCTSQHNTDNARAIAQQALLTMASEPAVWACALRIELLFAQRLLDGLIAEHQEEARKARKKALAASDSTAAAATHDKKGEEGEDGEEGQQPLVSVEPTAVIAPKLRAENASMGQVLLDLALAKTVVEESFESPASGAVLVDQLLATAGAFPFAREVVELIVSSALHKMLEACANASDATPSRAAAPSVASLSIVSHQQQLRVRTQWRHRTSVDTVLAAYLSLENSLVNGYATALVDAATYLADGGQDAIRRAHRSRSAKADRAEASVSLEHTFANPSLEDRRQAAAKALVSILAFAALPVSAVAALPGVGTSGDGDATQRLPAVRQALTDVLRRLAYAEPAEVSRVCAALLGRAATATAGESPKSAKGTKKKTAAASASASSGDHLAEMACWVLQQPTLDKAALQACVEAPRQRVQKLVEDLREAESTASPPLARTRTKGPSSSSLSDSSSSAAACVMTWSVLQLEQFLLAEDRDVLRGAAPLSTAAVTVKSKDSSSSAAAAAASAGGSPMTAEDVERFVVWWKEEEEAQRQQESAIVPASEVAASEARRRMAVVQLLRKHGLLPSPIAAALTAAQDRRAEADVWAATEAFLLHSGTTALQYSRPPGATLSGGSQSTVPALPLALWRVYSALETLVGQRGPNGATAAGGRSSKGSTPSAAADSDDSSSDDDDNSDAHGSSRGASRAVAVPAKKAPSSPHGGARLPSFAAAGLYFLSGVPQSSLSREEEWLRLEGVTSLLRCRLASWLGRRACTRDAVVEMLRAATAEAAEAWVADLQGLLTLAQRCQPLPRYAQTRCVLPFLEGVALYRQQTGTAAAGAAGQAAVQAARDAHEALLRLYGTSKHPESFLPLVYDGTSARKLAVHDSATATVGKASTAAVQQANTEDWVAYVLFERVVSKDLLRAKTVVEQGRRFALSPQQLMVKLNAL